MHRMKRVYLVYTPFAAHCSTGMLIRTCTCVLSDLKVEVRIAGC